MATKLRNIQLREISLVDKGANPGAHIMLMKRDAPLAKADRITAEMAEIDALEKSMTVTITKRDGETAEQAVGRHWIENPAAYGEYVQNRDAIKDRYRRGFIEERVKALGG